MAIPLGELGRPPGGGCFDLIIMTWTPEGFRATGGGKSDICCVEMAESSITTKMIHQVEGRGRKVNKRNTESWRVMSPPESKKTPHSRLETHLCFKTFLPNQNLQRE